jgi:hypothetical protein
VGRYFHRGNDLSGLDSLPVKQGEHLERINGVEPKQPVSPNVEHAVPFCHEIESALPGRPTLDSTAARGRRQPLSRFVLVQVAGLGPSQPDRLFQFAGTGCRYQCSTESSIQPGAFSERTTSEAEGCKQDGPGERGRIPAG